MTATHGGKERRQHLEADARQRALQRFLDLRRQFRDDDAWVLRDDDLALLAECPFARRLLGRLVEDVVVDVVVELVDRDLSVLVAVGGAAAQAFDQVVGEERILDVADHLIALPRVLRRVGGRQHDAAAAGPLEGRCRADRRSLGRLGADAEGAAVAAVEHEDEALRCAAVHPRRHIRGFDGGAGEHGAFGIAHGQIQVALLVPHAVAREVEQEQVVAMLRVEEPRDRLTDGREAFVQEGRDLVEGADPRRLQDLGERADIDVRRRELGEPRVLVRLFPMMSASLRAMRIPAYCGRGVPPGGVSVSVIFWMSSCTATSDAPSGYSMSTERSPTVALILTVRSLPRSDQA